MVKHIVHNGGIDGLMERLKKLSSQKVAVGIPADKNDAGRSADGTDDITNSDLVYIHTHGVRPREVRQAMQPDIDNGIKYSVAHQMYIQAHGSFVHLVPARPIIEPAIENSKAGIAKQLGAAASAAMNGEDTEKPLMDAGLYAQSKVKSFFLHNDWAPNAPKTIKRKGSDKPLIDTGALRNSITFVIRGDGK